MNMNMQALKGILLCGVFTISGLAFADDVVDAIHQMNDNLGGKLDAGNTHLGNIDTNTAALFNLENSDITRRQLLGALINYEAAARMKEYQLNQEQSFMAAPGSDIAIQAGKDIAGMTDLSLNISNQVFAANVGMITGAQSITLNSVPINLTPFQQAGVGTRVSLYQELQNFITSGDTTNLIKVNPGAVLLAPNLSKANPSISQDQSVAMVHNILDPFNAIDPVLQGKIKNLSQSNATPLDGSDMEVLAERVAESAVIGLSASVWGSAVNRRVPNATDNTSTMEVIENYGKERFTDPKWYTTISYSSDTALLREITHMLAYNSWVQSQQFQLQEQQVVLTASQNAILTKMLWGLNSIMKQMDAANAQAKLNAAKYNQQIIEQQQTTGGNTSTTTTGP